jgi:hypothetical protein
MQATRSTLCLNNLYAKLLIKLYPESPSAKAVTEMAQARTEFLELWRTASLNYNIKSVQSGIDDLELKSQVLYFERILCTLRKKIIQTVNESPDIEQVKRRAVEISEITAGYIREEGVEVLSHGLDTFDIAQIDNAALSRIDRRLTDEFGVTLIRHDN